jgi:hypothetical protein
VTLTGRPSLLHGQELEIYFIFIRRHFNQATLLHGLELEISVSLLISYAKAYFKHCPHFCSKIDELCQVTIILVIIFVRHALEDSPTKIEARTLEHLYLGIINSNSNAVKAPSNFNVN